MVNMDILAILGGFALMLFFVFVYVYAVVELSFAIFEWRYKRRIRKLIDKVVDQSLHTNAQ